MKTSPTTLLRRFLPAPFTHTAFALLDCGDGGFDSLASIVEPGQIVDILTTLNPKVFRVHCQRLKSIYRILTNPLP